MNQILKGVVKGLGQIGEETGKEIINETGKIAESIISGKELLGGVKQLTKEEQIKEQNKQQEELNKLRSAMGGGRNVEGEIKQVVAEKERKEEEEERQFLENIRRQREEERAQMAMEMESVSSNPAKRKKKRGSALMPGKKASPQDDQMSATSEFKGKVD